MQQTVADSSRALPGVGRPHLLGLLMLKAAWSRSLVTAVTLPGTLDPA